MPARTTLVSEFSVSDLCWSGSAAQSPQSPFPSAPRGRRRRVAAVGAGGGQPLAGRLAGAEQLQHQWGMEQTARCCCCGAGLRVKEGRHDLACAAAAVQPAATGGGHCPGWSLLPLLELSSAVRLALAASWCAACCPSWSDSSLDANNEAAGSPCLCSSSKLAKWNYTVRCTLL